MVSRRDVLRGVRKTAVGGFGLAALSGNEGATPDADARVANGDDGGWCHPIGGGAEAGTALSEDETVAWPDGLADHPRVEGDVKFPAHNVIEMETGGLLPCESGAPWRDDEFWFDRSEFSGERKRYDAGEPWRVAVFWADLAAGTSGIAPVGPFRIEDPDDEFLPGAYRSADSWICLDTRVGEGGLNPRNVPDAYVSYHELGHTLGYEHCDCGMMNPGGIEPRVNDMDFAGDDEDAEYLAESTKEIAKRAPHLRYAAPFSTDDLLTMIGEWTDGNLPAIELLWLLSDAWAVGEEVVYVTSDWVETFGLFEHNTDWDWDEIEYYRAGSYVGYHAEDDELNFEYTTTSQPFYTPGENAPFPPDRWDELVRRPGTFGGAVRVDTCDGFECSRSDRDEPADGECAPLESVTARDR